MIFHLVNETIFFPCPANTSSLALSGPNHNSFPLLSCEFPPIMIHTQSTEFRAIDYLLKSIPFPYRFFCSFSLIQSFFVIRLYAGEFSDSLRGQPSFPLPKTRSDPGSRMAVIFFPSRLFFPERKPFSRGVKILRVPPMAFNPLCE